MFEAKTSFKTALFLADGCEEIEALTVSDLLYRAGIPCTKVSIQETCEVTSSHDVKIIADTTVTDLSFEEYDMLILPGGIPGTPNLKACEQLTNAIVRFHEQGKQIAAICAAPSIFASLGLLKGIRATSNPAFKDALVSEGANYSTDPVVVSDNIITSRAMGTAIPFGLAIVAHYLGAEASDTLGQNILYT